MTYSVAIVVDPTFGEALHSLASRVHVWICTTPVNRTAVESYWRAFPDPSIERGATAFEADLRGGPENILLGILADVDLHHGKYSHTPPWDTLEVYGTSATPAIREALAEFGVDDVRPTPDGFRCSRPHKGAA